MKNQYIVEKTVESFRVYEVLEFAPASINTIIERIGFIPTLNRKLKKDATRRILITLEELGYAKQNELKEWGRGFKTL